MRCYGEVYGYFYVAPLVVVVVVVVVVVKKLPKPTLVKSLDACNYYT